MSTPTSSQAQDLKLQGNKHYTDRRFEEAFKCYNQASLLDPKNFVYLANQSAVLFETGLYRKCIDLCDESLANMVDQADPTGLKGRLQLRKARALFLLGNYETALLFLRQHPQNSVEEWKLLLRSAEDYAMRDQKCIGAENPPLAFECSVPSCRGSLLSPFYHFDNPTSEECPTSILLSNPTNISSSTAHSAAKTADNLLPHLRMLFAHNRDPRHLLETIKHVSMLPHLYVPTLEAYVLEQNPKLLARIILFLFVLGHPDLDDTSARHASDFVYFAWTGIALIPPHWTMLSETLHELCKLSFNLDTWRLDPRTSWIHFGDERDLKVVRDCWIMWGTVTEEKDLAKTNLLHRLSLLQKLSSKPIQTAWSTVKDQTWAKSPECAREMTFYLQHRLILPRPPLLEGDTQLPPVSMPSWMLNPLMDVIDSATAAESPEEKWVPEPRPDSLFPFAFAQRRDDLTPFSLFASMQLYDTISSLRSLKKERKLTVKAMCGNLIDLVDVGSRLGSIISEGDGILFDRIHTGCMADAMGLLETYVNALLLLKDSKDAHFSVSLNSELHSVRSASVNKPVFESLDHLLFNKLRLEKSHLSARFGLEVELKTDSSQHTMALVFKRTSPSLSLESPQSPLSALRRIDLMAKSNETYRTEHIVNNWFAQCCESPAISILRDGPCIEPASPNLAAFCRLLTLLLKTDTPPHWITQAVEKIFTGNIKAFILNDSSQEFHSKKPQSFTTVPYLTELSTMLAMSPGRRLWRAGIQHNLIDIASCHWYQAENVKIQNFAPTRKLPHNPSIVVLIADRRVNVSSKVTLVERLSTIEGNVAYRSVLEEYAKDITVISSVYWTGPSKVTEPSQVTFGFWLPDQFTCQATPSSNFALLIFRLDLYMCIGLSSLASMTCTTRELE